MSKIAGELNAEMSKTIGSKEYNEWLNSPLTKALKRSFEQSITDPENQPSQYGTVTLAMYEHLEEQITASQQRVAELEAQLERINPLLDEAADKIDALEKKRDELLEAAEAIEIDAEECLDFDDCSAMLVPIDTYRKLMEAIASVKEK